MNGTTYNFILDTDVYKLGSHHMMYPQNLDFITSYGECRAGSEYEELVFAGLKPIIAQMTGAVITFEKVEEAFMYFNEEQKNLFNYDGWMYIATQLDGKLPLEIQALREGTKIKKSNAMIQIRNTVKGFAWLVGHSETMITRVWETIGTATKSNDVRKLIAGYLEKTSDLGATNPCLDWMLHDFGARSATSYDHSGMYAAMHKLIFNGTDTIAGAKFAVDFYDANPSTILYWVPASEHSVMTINGREGEEAVFKRLLEIFPTGLLSVVDDSYDDNNFTTVFAAKYKDAILERGKNGKTVFRPDSGDPVECTLRQINNIAEVFGYTTNDKGYKILHPAVGILWGDGIDTDGIDAILYSMMNDGWSAENIVFGMGGALAQRHNRDTIAWAFKACAALFTENYTFSEQSIDKMHIDDIDYAVWSDVYKDPKSAGDDSSFTKASKRGIQKVIKHIIDGELYTVRQDDDKYTGYEDNLRVIFRDGEDYYDIYDTWEYVKERARV